MPSTLALIRNLFHDPRERSLAVGIWGAMASAGAAVGPVVGGLLLEHFWWGSVFLINLPVMAVLVAVGIKMIPESKNPAPGPWDLISVGLSLVGMIGVVYAIKEAAAHGVGWENVVAAVGGLLALTWFVRRQLKLPAPLLDMRLFHHRGFSGAVLADLLTILGLSGIVFFLSQFLQLVQGRGPLEAGLAELPAAVGAVTAGLLAGRVARRYSVRSVVAVGLGAIGLSLAVVTVIHKETGYPLIGVLLLVVGVGAGFAFTVTSDVILSSVPKEQAGFRVRGVRDGVRTRGGPRHRAARVHRHRRLQGLRNPRRHPGRSGDGGPRVAGRSRGDGGTPSGTPGERARRRGPGGLRQRAAGVGGGGRGGPARDGRGGVVPAARPAAGGRDHPGRVSARRADARRVDAGRVSA